MLLEFYGLQL
jgi:hypothetical protein